MPLQHNTPFLKMRSHKRGEGFVNDPMRLAVLISLLLLGALLVMLGTNRNGRVEKIVAAQILPLTGFDQVYNGVFGAVVSKDGFHALAAEISLAPHTYYHIRYDVSRLPREKVLVTTDLYAPGYDNPEQKLSKVFGMNMLGKSQDFVVNSGRSPERALIRLFYSGPPGLEIANVQITCVPKWWTWLKRGLIAGMLGALLVTALLAMLRFRNIPAFPQQGEANALRVLIGESPTVVAVFLFAVLSRYMMFIVIPYWSGDEYVYKSIAAGIWHFGRHGVLTDIMVSHSVNLPNLLYPYLISPAFALGENFYFGVRLINAMIINLTIFPCYLIARKFLDRTPALLAAMLSIAIPFVNLGAFAVPEVLFFPLFLLSIWVAIESIDRPASVAWIAAFGVMTAVLLNVRLNALVLLPAYLVLLLWISLKRRQALLLLQHPYWLGAVIAFLGTHILLQYLLGARQIGGLGVYRQVVERSDGPFAVVAKDPVGVFHLIVGHLTTLAIPFALPIALMMFSVSWTRSRRDIDRKFEIFLTAAMIFSFALFLLALTFTISVSPFDLGGIGRWHSRYYFFFYPLIIIAGVVFTQRLTLKEISKRRAVIAIVGFFLAANIYFIKFYGGPQIPWFGSIADNMDVQWYLPAERLYWLFIGFTVILTWLWHCRSAYFRKAFLGFIFSWAAIANYGTIQSAGVGTGVRQAAIQLIHANDTTLSAPCGSLAYNFLDHHPGRFVVVGDSYPTMVSAAFWNPFIPERTLTHSDISKLLGPVDVGVPADYLIANGDIRTDPIYRPILSVGKCVIYEIPNLR
jgi:4-amino-4-deoxy-L-arabinose transferase-like glycosyltransferase